MQIYRSNDPIKDAEQYAKRMYAPGDLHRCEWCDLDIDPQERFFERDVALGFKDGEQKWKKEYVCEYCLRSALEDLQRYGEDE